MLEKPICISYPKSGRTWLRMILSSLELELDYSHLDTGADKKSWGKNFDELNVPLVKNRKIIFLHRDPRDTVVSMFHEITKRQLPLLTAEQYSEYEKNNLVPALELGDFVRSSRFGIEKTIVFNILCRIHLDAHIVTYESLVNKPVESITYLLDYLGVSRSIEEINNAIEENNFKTMRKREQTGDIPPNMVGRLGPTNPSDINSFKVRRGVVGGYSTEMDYETQCFANSLLIKYNYKKQMNVL